MKVRELIHELLDYPMDSDVALEMRMNDNRLYHDNVVVVFEYSKGTIMISGDDME